jgi:hypothetical protein
MNNRGNEGADTKSAPEGLLLFGGSLLLCRGLFFTAFLTAFFVAIVVTLP